MRRRIVLVARSTEAGRISFAPFVSLSPSTGLAALAALAIGVMGLVACGGNDKAPLTPDSVEVPSTELPDAAAPTPNSSAVPAPPVTPPTK